MAQSIEVGSVLGGRYRITDHVVTSADQDLVFTGLDQVLNRRVTVLVASLENATQVASSARELATGERQDDIQVLDLGLSEGHTYLIAGGNPDPDVLLGLAYPQETYVEPFQTDTLGSEIFGSSRDAQAQEYDDDEAYYTDLDERVRADQEQHSRRPGFLNRLSDRLSERMNSSSDGSAAREAAGASALAAAGSAAQAQEEEKRKAEEAERARAEEERRRAEEAERARAEEERRRAEEEEEERLRREEETRRAEEAERARAEDIAQAEREAEELDRRRARQIEEDERREQADAERRAAERAEREEREAREAEEREELRQREEDRRRESALTARTEAEDTSTAPVPVVPTAAAGAAVAGAGGASTASRDGRDGGTAGSRGRDDRTRASMADRRGPQGDTPAGAAPAAEGETPRRVRPAPRRALAAAAAAGAGATAVAAGASGAAAAKGSRDDAARREDVRDLDRDDRRDREDDRDRNGAAAPVAAAGAAGAGVGAAAAGVDHDGRDPRGPGDEERGEGKGGAGWLVGLLLVLLLVGLLIGGYFLLNQNRGAVQGENQATAAPTGSASSSETASPTQSAASPTEDGSPTPSESAPAAEPAALVDVYRTVPDNPPLESEHDGELPNIIDGNPDTFWQSYSYRRPNFGGYARSMNFVVELQEPRDVTTVTVDSLASTGGTIAIGIAGEEGLGDLRRGGEGTFVDGTAEVDIADEQGEARYVVVTVTELPQLTLDNSQYAYGLRLSEITVE